MWSATSLYKIFPLLKTIDTTVSKYHWTQRSCDFRKLHWLCSEQWIHSQKQESLLKSLTPLSNSFLSPVGESYTFYFRKCFFATQKKPVSLLDSNMIRNVAVIAHVDHGKTTLVDSLIKQGGNMVSVGERVMDSNELEKERGITILSKTTRIEWNGYVLNIIDTPGHADFGGEVERILSMVDGVCLIIDIIEGPKTQTKFVLKKALLNPSMKSLVIVNKVDRPNVREKHEIEDDIFDLYAGISGVTDTHIDYAILYASGKQGWCVDSFEKYKETISSVHKANEFGVTALFEKLVSHVPPPLKKDIDQEPFHLLVTMVEFLKDFGLTVTGKVYGGWLWPATLKDPIYVKSVDGQIKGQLKLKDLTVVKGTQRTKLESAVCGDIVSLSFGSASLMISPTDTVCSDPTVEPVPSRPIDPPVIFIDVSCNTSPLAGQDGHLKTLQAIENRLRREALVNVAIDVAWNAFRTGFEVKGRGELQLGILIETMRREGFEMSLSSPSVIYETDEKGRILEPWETFHLDVPTDASGAVVDKLASRDARILDISSNDDRTMIKCECSTKNFMGISPFLRDASKGSAIVHNEFLEYRPRISLPKSSRPGVIISCAFGKTTQYALDMVQCKGQLFLSESVPVYPGMLLGECNCEKDELMNPTKEKPPSNLRGKINDVYKLNIRPMTIEACIGYIEEDEQIEVTPKRIAMRKRILDADERKKANRLASKLKSQEAVAQHFPDKTGRTQRW